MKVLVCGGRDFNDRDTLEHVLSNIGRIDVLVQGGAPGADGLAKRWAMEHGVQVAEYPANWEAWGKRAGPVRNEVMLLDSQPDMVIAFPTKGSKGTWHMVGLARGAGLDPVIIEEESE